MQRAGGSVTVVVRRLSVEPSAAVVPGEYAAATPALALEPSE